jgi:hypothetical protein
MPIATVNLSAVVFEEIKALVEKGLYKGLEQFLEIAAFNQLALERGVSAADILQSGHRNQAGLTRTATREPVGKRSILVAEEPINGRQLGPPRSPEKIGRQVVRIRSTNLVNPEAELKDFRERLSISEGLTTSSPVQTTPRPSGERLWGQVNRLFPLKLATRWIAKKSNGAEWAVLGEVSDALADDAATIGSILEALDMRSGRKRDDLLATGLPRRANQASRDRFLSQYIARVTRAAEIFPGAICQYSLAAFQGERLALTDAGLQFTTIPNPILDQGLADAKAALSEEERVFLRNHIRANVSGEFHDLQLIVNSVVDGKDTPERLLKATRSKFPAQWSDLMARTQVSGLLARAVDLGLMSRVWDGRNVTYQASPSCSQFMAA